MLHPSCVVQNQNCPCTEQKGKCHVCGWDYDHAPTAEAQSLYVQAAYQQYADFLTHTTERSKKTSSLLAHFRKNLSKVKDFFGTERVLSREQDALAAPTHPDTTSTISPSQIAYQQGKWLQKQGRFQEAIIQFSAALHRDPYNALYYASRSDCYYALNQKQHALADIDQALHYETNNALFYQKRGKIYYSLMQYDQALSHYTRALILDPYAGLFYHSRGQCYFALGKNRSAQADYQHAIRLYTREIERKPHHAALYFYRGLCYLTLHEKKQAAYNFTCALTLEPSVEYYAFRALCHLLAQENEAAYTDFNHALALNDHENALYLGRAYCRSHLFPIQYDAILADLKKAVHLQPCSTILYFLRGQYYFKRGQYQAALSDMNHALKQQAPPAFFYFLRGQCYFKLHYYQAALTDCSLAIQKEPNNPVFYYARSNCYFKLGKNIETYTDIDYARQLNPNLWEKIRNEYST